jgi:hypothetical protein
VIEPSRNFIADVLKGWEELKALLATCNIAEIEEFSDMVNVRLTPALTDHLFEVKGTFHFTRNMTLQQIVADEKKLGAFVMLAVTTHLHSQKFSFEFSWNYFVQIVMFLEAFFRQVKENKL